MTASEALQFAAIDRDPDERSKEYSPIVDSLHSDLKSVLRQHRRDTSADTSGGK